MKREDLTAKTKSELYDQLLGLKKDLMSCRFQRARNELASTAQIRDSRRQIARVLTQLNQLEGHRK